MSRKLVVQAKGADGSMKGTMESEPETPEPMSYAHVLAELKIDRLEI